MFDPYKKPRIQRRIPERTPLRVIKDRIMELTDPNRLLRSRVSELDRAFEEKERMALESGAMPSEFRVAMVFRTAPGRRMEVVLR